MKNFFHFFFFLSITCLLSSCFEITEQINVKKDGSGDVLLTVNLNESKQNLDNFLKMEEVNGVQVPKIAEMEGEVDKIKGILQNIKGISNVNISTDYESYIFKVSSDFANVAALNKAINTVAEKLNRSPFATIKEDNFAFANKEFTRLFNYDIDASEYDKLDMSARMIMESAKLVSIFRFDQPVQEISNANAQVAPNKLAVKLETSIADLVKGNKTIENKVRFK